MFPKHQSYRYLQRDVSNIQQSWNSINEQQNTDSDSCDTAVVTSAKYKCLFTPLCGLISLSAQEEPLPVLFFSYRTCIYLICFGKKAVGSLCHFCYIHSASVNYIRRINSESHYPEMNVNRCLCERCSHHLHALSFVNYHILTYSGKIGHL